MELRRQILTLSLSVILAAAVALLVPHMSDAVAPSEGVLLGLLVLLSAGLLHEYAARMARQDRTVRQLLLMARGYSSLRDEVSELRERLEGVGATLVMAPPERLRAGDPRRFDRVIAAAEGRASGMSDPAAPDRAPDDPETTAVETKDADETTAGLAESDVLAVLRRALAEDRVDLYLQPVVSLPQRKRQAYECFSRLRSAEGFRLLPAHYLALAERKGLVAALDGNLLARAAQLVRKVQDDGDEFDFFCNVSQQTLGKQDFLRSLAANLTRNRAPARNLVLELSQADLRALSAPALMGLRQVTHLGCRLSMDQVKDLEMSAEALAETGVRFVKLEAALLLEQMKPGHRLLGELKAAGIEVIIEKLEDEDALKELLDYEIALAQGYLFSKPRMARPAA